MNESKYLLTYDFKILYCANIKLKLSCKELDLKTLTFIKYNGNLNMIDYFFEINTDALNDIVGDVFRCKFGHELSSSDMEWIQKIEKVLKLNKSIYNNENLMFNYYMLKLKLAGFKEELAMQFTKSYFYMLNESDKIDSLPSLKDSIEVLNDIISLKEIWIGNNLYNYTQLEEDFLRTVLNYKRKLSYQFNFDMFKDDYLNIIQNSFIAYIYEFNKTESYLVRKAQTLLNNKSYMDVLIDIYKRIITGIIQYLIENGEYSDFAEDDYKFVNNLMENMKDTVKLYLTIFEDHLN